MAGSRLVRLRAEDHPAVLQAPALVARTPDRSAVRALVAFREGEVHEPVRGETRVERNVEEAAVLLGEDAGRARRRPDRAAARPLRTTRRPRYFSVTRSSPSGRNARLQGRCKPPTRCSSCTPPWTTGPALAVATAFCRAVGSAAWPAASHAQGSKANNPKKRGITRVMSRPPQSEADRLADSYRTRAPHLANSIEGDDRRGRTPSRI